MSVVATRPPLTFAVAGIATTFFTVGFTLILAEALFFREIMALTTTPISTRAFIGFHLFPSEIWFIFIGTGLAAPLLARECFLVSKHVFDNAIPVFIALGVYMIWFVYGATVGNSWALQEFREMVFTAFSLPAILYFAPHANVALVFNRVFIAFGLLVIPAAGFIGFSMAGYDVHNALLILATFIVGFYLFKLLHTRKSAVLPLGLITLPFLLKFAKPMVALLLFTVLVSVALAGHLNRDSVRWVLSKFKLKMVLTLSVLLASLLLLVIAINLYYDGVIEQAMRFYVLKERLTASGDLRYGDLSGGRMAIWGAALDGWTKRPFLGHGLGAPVDVYGTGWLVKTQFHNYALQALHNTGLIGSILIAGAWGIWIRRTVASVAAIGNFREQLLPAAMLIYILGIFFYGLYGHSLSYPPSAQLFWLSVGFLCALSPRTKESQVGTY